MTPPVLTTRRLTLRPLTAQDADAITQGLRNWDVVQWLTGPKFPYARFEAQIFLEKTVVERQIWAIDAGNGLIGIIQLTPDLGFWLDVEYQGQRVMIEAATAAVNWHFAQGQVTLKASHLVGNMVARAILVELGFEDTDLDTVMQNATQERVQIQRMLLSTAITTTS